MPRIVHFELPASDPEGLATFYRKVFDWKIDKWEGPVDYWLVTTGEEGLGINGAILARSPAHRDGPVNMLDVPSVDEYLEKAQAEGGQLVSPKMAIPGIGYVAYCRDTAGNVFGLFQGDDTAA